MSDPSGFGALAQMLPALALIIGALLLVKRWAARGGRLGPVEGVKVLSRTGLTRGAVVAVVEVAGKRYLLGAGEHGVRLLTEIDSDFDLGADLGVPTVVAPAPTAPRAAAMDSLLRSSTQRPWMGLVNRLQAMTVRTDPSRARDASLR